MVRSDVRVDAQAWSWVAFVVVASLLLSRAFACAMPFAALSVLAAVTLPRRGLVLMLGTWLGNQLIGFGLMGFPWTGSTLGWGVAIGAATLAGWGAARGIAAVMPTGAIGRSAAGLAAAFAGYEAVLLLATLVLPSGSGAFAAAVMLRILAINAAALALFMIARRLAATVGWMPPVRIVRHQP